MIAKCNLILENEKINVFNLNVLFFYLFPMKNMAPDHRTNSGKRIKYHEHNIYSCVYFTQNKDTTIIVMTLYLCLDSDKEVEYTYKQHIFDHILELHISTIISYYKSHTFVNKLQLPVRTNCVIIENR